MKHKIFLNAFLLILLTEMIHADNGVAEYTNQTIVTNATASTSIEETSDNTNFSTIIDQNKSSRGGFAITNMFILIRTGLNINGGNSLSSFIVDSLLPSPDFMYLYSYGSEFDWYLFWYFGLSIGREFGALSAYKSAEYNTPDRLFLDIFGYDFVYLRILGRFPLYVREWFSLFIRGFVGGSFDNYTYTEDFRKIVDRSGSPYVWPETAYGWGLTAGGGIYAQLARFVIGLDVSWEQKFGLQFPPNRNITSFSYWTITLYMGGNL